MNRVMKRKSKGELREALAEIMELAKAHRDLSDSGVDRMCFDQIVNLSYHALEHASMAVVDELRASAKSRRNPEPTTQE